MANSDTHEEAKHIDSEPVSYPIRRDCLQRALQMLMRFTSIRGKPNALSSVQTPFLSLLFDFALSYLQSGAARVFSNMLSSGERA